MFLTDPVEAGAAVPQDADLLPIPPFDVPVDEIAAGGDPEPLDEVGPPLHVRPAYWESGLPGASDRLWLRRGVLDRLVAAAASLPAPFGLCVLDGWRSRSLQRHLFEASYGYGDLLPGYVSNPDDDRVVPPHVTGGAVDLTLTWKGEPLALGSDFDAFDESAWAQAFEIEGADTTTRDLRRLLTSCLLQQGFCGYPLEWWHFSHGDQRWAAFSGHSKSKYGPTTPDLRQGATS